jgi:hypothetical protein
VSAPPNSEAQWAQIEAAATDRAKGAGAAEVAPPVRLRQDGPFVIHPTRLSGGRCYHVGVAWASPEPESARVSLRCTQVNASLGGRDLTMSAPGGELAFCADNEGDCKLSIAPLGRGGIMASGRMEYAVVFGSTPEAAADATARHGVEAAQAAEGRAMREANLRNADARAHGEAFAVSCARCRSLVWDCSGARQACIRQFEICAQSLGTDARGNVSCAHP